MPKITGKYETIFIVNATLTEEAIKGLVEKFTNLIAANGEITKAVTVKAEAFSQAAIAKIEAAGGKTEILG